MTLRGYADAMFAWFGQEAKLAFLPWEAWRERQDPAETQTTFEHIARSPCCSIAKAERLLGYVPRYTSLEAVQEAVAVLIEAGDLPVDQPSDRRRDTGIADQSAELTR